jgi:acetyltransferase-like isoleucine patch superfamily enzyme/dTDP-4-dehydrorhamnose 3,5-epimerase-like enzyme
LSDFFVHPQGICESIQVGSRTRIWAFAHVLPGARIGADCNICDHVFIENHVVVGDRVTVKCGVQLWDGVRLEDDVFVGPNATFTNNPFPRSRQWLAEHPVTRVCEGASIGANATILPGLTIGRNAMIGAGSVVTGDVPPNAIVYGNPSRIHGYVGAPKPPSEATRTLADETQELVGGARLIRLTMAQDLRGRLVAAELARDVPFVPRRFFAVYRVPTTETRGEHAHRSCHQFLICLAGSVIVMVDDGTNRAQVLLDDPGRGLYIPPMVWGTQYEHSPDAILAVLASDPYDADDYIRDYDEFLRLTNRGMTTGASVMPLTAGVHQTGASKDQDA